MIQEFLFKYLPSYMESKYLVAIIIFLAFFALSKLVHFVAGKFVLALARKTRTHLDDALIEKTNNPVSWLLIFIGARIAFEYLVLPGIFQPVVEKAANSAIYLSVAAIGVVVVSTLIDHWGSVVAKRTKSTMDDALVPLFRRTTTVIIMVIVGIMVLDLWGVNVTGLLAGVGIAGIAIGFAVKDSLANVFGGVSLIVDKTFNVGDRIALDDGTMGVVQDVGIRATRIKTFDNEVVVVPNGMLANMKIKNFNLPDPTSRVVINFSVEYGADPDKVKNIVLGEINKMEDVMADPAPLVRFDAMADSSLAMKAFFWVDDTSKVPDRKEEATTRIYNALNKNKIGIPFPTSTVYLQKSGKRR
jgi:MscS family membrane protein